MLKHVNISSNLIVFHEKLAAARPVTPGGGRSGRPRAGRLLSAGVLVFTAGLAFLGVGLFFVILGLAATAIVEGRVSLFSRSRRMRRRLEELRGHYIVCAYDRVGLAIARELEAEGVPFVVVDSKGQPP